MISRLLHLLLCALALLLLAAPSAWAQSAGSSRARRVKAAPAPRLDVQMILASDGKGQDSLAVAYGRDVPDAEIHADFEHLAGLLHIPPPQVRITKKAGIPAAEAKVSGLTNWNTGEVSLDPLVDTFKRFGFFRLVCLFLGNFPLQSADSFTRPPLRVEVNRTSPNVVNYQIWVDQRGGVPRSLPSTVQRNGWGWKGYVGVAALSLVVVGAVFLVVMVLLGQRRTAEKSRGN